MTKCEVEIFSCSWAPQWVWWLGGCSPGNPCACVAPISENTRGARLLYFYRDPEGDWKGRAGSSWEGCDQGGVSGDWTTQLQSSTAAQLEVADWSEGVQVPSCPFSSSLLKTGVLSLPLKTGLQPPLPEAGMGRNHTSGRKLFFQTPVELAPKWKSGWWK